MTRNPISRRKTLGMLAVTATGGLFMNWERFAASRPALAQSPLITGAGICSIMPRTTEGPFYFDQALDRQDITEGRAGVALDLRIQVVDASCNPIAGARVDIWHCDATASTPVIRASRAGSTRAAKRSCVEPATATTPASRGSRRSIPDGIRAARHTFISRLYPMRAAN